MPDSPVTTVAERDPRIYFAAERTLLAWIRTGIALMAFGFAIARFGLYLRQLQAFTGSSAAQVRIGSRFTGVALIVVGVVSILLSTAQYSMTIRRLREGSWMPGRLSKPAIVLAIVLIAVGVFMTIQLLKIS